MSAATAAATMVVPPAEKLVYQASLLGNFET
eukprot:COSAG02_NODE_7262_length_3092_cov_1.273973_5_plen_30_part_01